MPHIALPEDQTTVDELGTWQPHDASMYAQMGKHLAEHGYLKPSR